MRVLVTGATGFVGSRLVPRLLAAGHEVTALVRDTDGYDAPEGVRVLAGDLLEPGSFRLVAGAGETPGQPLDRLLAALDVDAAYYLAHPLRIGDDAAERDRRAARTFADAADAAGVDRVVYLGSLAEAGEDPPERLADRRAVAAALAEGAPALTTLRADLVVGEGGAGFEMLRGLAAGPPLMVTPRWVRTECRPIAVDDVVAFLVGTLDAPATAGGTYELCGPETVTFGELLRRTRSERGGRLFAIPAPVRSPGLSARWVALVTDIEVSVARPLVDGLCTGTADADGDLREHVPVSLTPLDEALGEALAGVEATGSAAPAAATGD